jgi:hypothetical protein
MSVGMLIGVNPVYHRTQECCSFASEDDNPGLVGLDEVAGSTEAVAVCLVEAVPSRGRVWRCVPPRFRDAMGDLEVYNLQRCCEVGLDLGSEDEHATLVPVLGGTDPS